MRIALAILMALHGAAHLVGFVGAWRLAGPESNIPYKTTVLGGTLGLGGPGMRAMGVFWLLTAVAFMVAAMAALMGQGWWPLAAVGVTLFSLVLCVIGLPEARIGVAVNVVILAALLLGQRFGLLSTVS